MLTPESLAVLRCPESGVRLSIASEALTAHLLQLAKTKALRNSAAALVANDFEGGLVTANRARIWLTRSGVADFRPGTAVLLLPDDPP